LLVQDLKGSELRVTSGGQRAMGCELRVTSYEPRAKHRTSNLKPKSCAR